MKRTEPMATQKNKKGSSAASIVRWDEMICC